MDFDKWLTPFEEIKLPPNLYNLLPKKIYCIKGICMFDIIMHDLSHILLPTIFNYKYLNVIVQVSPISSILMYILTKIISLSNLNK